MMSLNSTLTSAPAIYGQHDKAFQHVSAFVITKSSSLVATIAFKFPKDGAGRLWVYLHVIGLPMVRGYANGYGYDKRSAALENAVKKIKTDEFDPLTYYGPITAALADIGGSDWKNRLLEAGFQVFQAV